MSNHRVKQNGDAEFSYNSFMPLGLGGIGLGFRAETQLNPLFVRENGLFTDCLDYLVVVMA